MASVSSHSENTVAENPVSENSSFADKPAEAAEAPAGNKPESECAKLSPED